MFKFVQSNDFDFENYFEELNNKVNLHGCESLYHDCIFKKLKNISMIISALVVLQLTIA